MAHPEAVREIPQGAESDIRPLIYLVSAALFSAIAGGHILATWLYGWPG